MCIDHYVSKINNCAKFGEDRTIGAIATRLWNITLLCVFMVSFPFLPFFILVVAYSLNAWTDFDGWWLKMRRLVQGRAFYMFEPSPTIFWGWYPLKTTPKKPLMLKSQPNTQTRITSKRFKIDKKSQCNMDRKSGSPFWNLLSEISCSAP